MKQSVGVGPAAGKSRGSVRRPRAGVRPGDLVMLDDGQGEFSAIARFKAGSLAVEPGT